MIEFVIQSQWLLWPLLAWTLYWKGRALWIAALKRHKWWFIALLVVNTLGIFEILYIYWLSNRRYKVARVFTQTFVAIAALIEKGGKVLLVREAQAGPDTGKWNHPAGWLEVGEDPVAAIKKEVKEETGLDFEPQGLVGVYSLVRNDLKQKLHNPPHNVRLVFRGTVTDGEPAPQDADEISEVRYFTRDEINTMDGTRLRDIDIKQAINDYFDGTSYPLNALHHTIAT